MVSDAYHIIIRTVVRKTCSGIIFSGGRYTSLMAYFVTIEGFRTKQASALVVGDIPWMSNREVTITRLSQAFSL